MPWTTKNHFNFIFLQKILYQLVNEFFPIDWLQNQWEAFLFKQKLCYQTDLCDNTHLYLQAFFAIYESAFSAISIQSYCTRPKGPYDLIGFGGAS